MAERVAAGEPADAVLADYDLPLPDLRESCPPMPPLRRVRIERTQLADEVGHLERQQAELSHRLASVPELRQAMQEAVRVRRRDRRQAWLAQIARQREQDRTAAQQGNRGYVVYEGTPTLTSGPRLSIRVLNPEPLSSPSETSP